MSETKHVRLFLCAVVCALTALASPLAVSAAAPTPQVLRFNEGGGGAYDRAGATTVDSAGNFYVTGSAETSNQLLSLVVIKYNPQGTRLWRTLVTNGQYAQGGAITVDAQGNVYVTGFAGGGLFVGATFDGFTVKLNSGGAVQWSRRYGAPGANEGFADVAVDDSGNVYVSGTAQAQTADWLTLKYGPDGTQIWDRRFSATPTSNDVLIDMVRDSAGNLVLAGNTQRTGDFQTNDFSVLKYDPAGNVLWTSHHTETPLSHEFLRDMAVDAAGGVYLTGTTAVTVSPYDPAFPLTVKFDSAGAFQFVLRDGAAGGESVTTDASGAFYVTGFFFGMPEFSHVSKYNANGTLVWATPFAFSGGGAVSQPLIATDPAGNVYISGTGGNTPGTGNDYFTAKYDPAGVLVWEHFFDGVAHGSDSVAALVIDGQGTVYVTGTSWGQYSSIGGTANDIVSLKFAPGGETPPSGNAPASPTQLSAQAVNASRINLQWSDASGNETGFVIERCTGGNCVTYSEVARVGANVTSFANTGLNRNTTYSYRVRAFNDSAMSGSSNTATARTPRR
jgi:hypothetical protein